MRRASLALALVSIVLAVGLLARPAGPALAAYNISGNWQISFDGGPPCPATITQTYPASIDADIVCNPYFPIHVSGNINVTTGGFSASGTVYTSTFTMNGVLSADNHNISGNYINDPMSGSPIYGTFSGTGGSGDPKPGSPTPTPTRTSTATPLPPTLTPPPVGGVSLDVSTVARSDSRSRTWLIAVAGVSVVAMGGAALFARSRRA